MLGGGWGTVRSRTRLKGVQHLRHGVGVWPHDCCVVGRDQTWQISMGSSDPLDGNGAVNDVIGGTGTEQSPADYDRLAGGTGLRCVTRDVMHGARTEDEPFGRRYD